MRSRVPLSGRSARTAPNRLDFRFDLAAAVSVCLTGSGGRHLARTVHLDRSLLSRLRLNTVHGCLDTDRDTRGIEVERGIG